MERLTVGRMKRREYPVDADGNRGWNYFSLKLAWLYLVSYHLYFDFVGSDRPPSSHPPSTKCQTGVICYIFKKLITKHQHASTAFNRLKPAQNSIVQNVFSNVFRPITKCRFWYKISLKCVLDNAVQENINNRRGNILLAWCPPNIRTIRWFIHQY